MAQLHYLQQVGDFLFNSIMPKTLPLCQDRQTENDIFSNGHAAKQSVVLEHKPYVAIADVHPADVFTAET